MSERPSLYILSRVTRTAIPREGPPIHETAVVGVARSKNDLADLVSKTLATHATEVVEKALVGSYTVGLATADHRPTSSSIPACQLTVTTVPFDAA